MMSCRARCLAAALIGDFPTVNPGATAISGLFRYLHPRQTAKPLHVQPEPVVPLDVAVLNLLNGARPVALSIFYVVQPVDAIISD